jgi:peptide-methionine (S)-S-oxide reductase
MPVPPWHEGLKTPMKPPFPAEMKQAVFGMGCFWGVEKTFWKVPGVYSTSVGYAGGFTPNPTYEEVCTGRTGHTEVVLVVYDPARVSYEQLLAHFWRTIDPTDPNGQFCDKGSPYLTAIFVHDAAQLAAARASLAALQTSKPFREPIVTKIELAGPFYPAEAYHQDYYRKNPVRYNFYRNGCGRDARLKQLWG